MLRRLAFPIWRPSLQPRGSFCRVSGSKARCSNLSDAAGENLVSTGASGLRSSQPRQHSAAWGRRFGGRDFARQLRQAYSPSSCRHRAPVPEFLAMRSECGPIDFLNLTAALYSGKIGHLTNQLTAFQAGDIGGILVPICVVGDHDRNGLAEKIISVLHAYILQRAFITTKSLFS